MKKYGLYALTFAVFLTQIPSNRACYAKMDFYITSINVPLTYKIIGAGSKSPVLTLRISNTQEKVRHIEPRKRNRTMRILNENANGKTQSL